MNTANNPTEARELISHCEKIIKTQHKQVMQYIYRQWEILKMFKETENFFVGSEQSRLRIYFKIAVYKRHRKSKLLGSYFCNNLRSIKLICKKCLGFFSR